MKAFTHWTRGGNIISFVDSCVDKETLSGQVIRLLVGATISSWTRRAGSSPTPTVRQTKVTS